MKSIRPRTYVGRIVISTTDDVESKVIAHYGGTRWKRVMNFLRGVEPDSDSLGSKQGEAFVSLRASNIATHAHALQTSGTDGSGGDDWTGNPNRLEVGGQGATSQAMLDTNTTTSPKTRKLNSESIPYHVSTLRESDPATRLPMPHANIPPYREVYIWECVSVTEDQGRDQTQG